MMSTAHLVVEDVAFRCGEQLEDLVLKLLELLLVGCQAVKG